MKFVIELRILSILWSESFQHIIRTSPNKIFWNIYQFLKNDVLSTLKFKVCYALCFVYNREDILCLVYPRNVSSCLKAMPSVVIIWNLLLKTQPAAAHSYYFQSVILAWFVSSNFDSKSRTVKRMDLYYLLSTALFL